MQICLICRLLNLCKFDINRLTSTLSNNVMHTIKKRFFGTIQWGGSIFQNEKLQCLVVAKCQKEPKLTIFLIFLHWIALRKFSNTFPPPYIVQKINYIFVNVWILFKTNLRVVNPKITTIFQILLFLSFLHLNKI